MLFVHGRVRTPKKFTVRDIRRFPAISRIMAPPRNAQALCAALPDVEAVTFPETGHALMAERPGDVLDALRRFL